MTSGTRIKLQEIKSSVCLPVIKGKEVKKMGIQASGTIPALFKNLPMPPSSFHERFFFLTKTALRKLLLRLRLPFRLFLFFPRNNLRFLDREIKTQLAPFPFLASLSHPCFIIRHQKRSCNIPSRLFPLKIFFCYNHL